MGGGTGILAVYSKVPYERCVDKKRPTSKTTARRVFPVSLSIGKARGALLKWHAEHGRHDLPWRRDNRPYAVLVSEFMLQQTTVATVMPRFHEWMRRFPTLADLASASEQEVLSAWEGLGYYSRARRLHAAAKAVTEIHWGILPTAEKDLLSLPGVGAYTAAAIRAFAHDEQAVVLDTNIIRVLARWGNITAAVDFPGGKQTLGALAAAIFPDSKCRAIASALMDLGAMICKAGKPDCASCPLRTTCSAVSPENLPKKTPRRVTTKLTEHRAWFDRGRKLYLEQSAGPRWGGLWILPELGTGKPAGRPLAEITYPITRYRVTMRLFPIKGAIPKILKGFSREELSSLPIPTPHRKAIGKAFRAIAEE